MVHQEMNANGTDSQTRDCSRNPESEPPSTTNASATASSAAAPLPKDSEPSSPALPAAPQPDVPPAYTLDSFLEVHRRQVDHHPRLWRAEHLVPLRLVTKPTTSTPAAFDRNPELSRMLQHRAKLEGPFLDLAMEYGKCGAGLLGSRNVFDLMLKLSRTDMDMASLPYVYTWGAGPKLRDAAYMLRVLGNFVGVAMSLLRGDLWRLDGDRHWGALRTESPSASRPLPAYACGCRGHPPPGSASDAPTNHTSTTNTFPLAYRGSTLMSQCPAGMLRISGTSESQRSTCGVPVLWTDRRMRTPFATACAFLLACAQDTLSLRCFTHSRAEDKVAVSVISLVAGCGLAQICSAVVERRYFDQLNTQGYAATPLEIEHSPMYDLKAVDGRGAFLSALASLLRECGLEDEGDVELVHIDGTPPQTGAAQATKKRSKKPQRESIAIVEKESQ